MALSNAERQARYRARLKAKVTPEALVPAVRAVADTALAALWAYFSRPTPAGDLWADIEGCTTIADYRDLLARDPGALLRSCREVISFGVGLLPEEAVALNAVVELADALALIPADRDPAA